MIFILQKLKTYIIVSRRHQFLFENLKESTDILRLMQLLAHLLPKSSFLCHFYFQYLDINSFEILTTLKKQGNEKECTGF